MAPNMILFSSLILLVLPQEFLHQTAAIEDYLFINKKLNATEEWEDFMDAYKFDYNLTSYEAYGYKNFSCVRQFSYSQAPNVHMLGPADVGVVAAMGDSLTAANGAGATRFIDVRFQYRGLSFSIGGDGVLENTVTLPNILRKYNPNIYGASVGVETVHNEKLSKFNVAVPGARARDLPNQASQLITRLKKERQHLDQWKIVTIFIGGNDVCRVCHEMEERLNNNPVERWIQSIGQALGILSGNLTKTFVNLVPVPPVFMLRRLEDDYRMCNWLHQLECRCVSKSYPRHEAVDQIDKDYQKALQSLTHHYERWDFTVVVQPFMTMIAIPVSKVTHKADLSYMAPDCFHFSRRSHAASAAFLWNNMLQPVGNKTESSDPSKVTMECPDQECPYFRTEKNSQNCTRAYLLSESNIVKRTYSTFLSMAQLERSYVSDANSTSRSAGAALWIFLGLIIGLTVGIFSMYCWQKTRVDKTKFKNVNTNEKTPLLTFGA